MNSASRPAMLLVAGRSVGLAASFAIGIVLVRLFDPGVFGVYKQFFLIYATLYGVLQLGIAESLYYFVPRAPEHTGRYAGNALVALGLTGATGIGVLWLARPAIAGCGAEGGVSAGLPAVVDVQHQWGVAGSSRRNASLVGMQPLASNPVEGAPPCRDHMRSSTPTKDSAKRSRCSQAGSTTSTCMINTQTTIAAVSCGWSDLPRRSAGPESPTG